MLRLFSCWTGSLRWLNEDQLKLEPFSVLIEIRTGLWILVLRSR